MSRYKIVHSTGFKYQGEVTASYNEARLLPQREENQLVLSSRLEITPSGTQHENLDYFKTRTTMFEVFEPHTELTITSTSVVELRNSPQQPSAISWQELQSAKDTSLEITDALIQSKRTQPQSELTKLAKKSASKFAPHDAAMDISKAIFDLMTYEHGVTGVHSIAAEAWSKKVGVCQDFAHITIGALRAIGIPARYVSGYLHPKIEPVIGEKISGESHAWVEWWAGSWFAWDPTNNIPVGDRHIVVGRGRDYDDVPPLRGVYAGGHSSELFVTVEITKEA